MANKRSAKSTKISGKNNLPIKKKTDNTYKREIHNEEPDIQRNPKKQVWAVILFAFAIFIFCLSIFEGTALWRFLRNLMFGLFGVCGYVIAPLIAYIAIITALDQPNFKLKNKVIQAISMLVIISTAIHIFFINEGVRDFFSQLSKLYQDAIPNINGGAVGGFFGMFLISILGETGAKIIICILICVFLILVMGITLTSILGLGNKKEKRDNHNRIEDTLVFAKDSPTQRSNTKFDIDIDLDDEIMPSHPVEAKPFEKPKKAEKTKFSKKTSLAFERLMENITGTNAPEEEKVKFSEKYKQANKEIVEELDSEIYELENLLNKASNKKDKRYNSEKSFQFREDDFNNEKSNYKFPPINLLEKPRNISEGNVKEELKANAELLVNTLQSFGVETRIVNISRGPAVTRYELQPSAGVKISRITNLSDDIALNLAAAGVRIEAPIPNKAAVGIEVPNKNTAVVKIRDLIDTNIFESAKSKLTVALGKDISGNISLADLAKMPHMLIAGATGSGKSVCINTILISLLYKASPDDIRLLMIDPKVVELGIYNGIPHLLVPVVTDPRKAAGALHWAVNEMLGRYKLFADNNVRDLSSYNKLAARTEELNKLPQIVIVIDELADLMMAAPNEVEDSICRLAQMARAAGMHLVIATQRPSVDVITGIIKANIPSRIAFSVSSQVDSRTILDMGGAEKLLGRGDMLFYPMGASKPIRIQGCFVNNNEVETVINFVKNSYENKYDEQIVEEIEKQAIPEKKEKMKNSENKDEMLDSAIECVVEAGEASTSMLQRRLRLGYARAGRLIDEMEQMGIVGHHEGSKPRQVLISRQQWIEMKMNNENQEEN